MYFLCIFTCVCANVCVMEQMVFRPLCAIEKCPYVFAGLTKCKHTMFLWERKKRYGDIVRDVEDCQHWSGADLLAVLICSISHSHCTNSVLCIGWEIVTDSWNLKKKTSLETNITHKDCCTVSFKLQCNKMLFLMEQKFLCNYAMTFNANISVLIARGVFFSNILCV